VTVEGGSLLQFDFEAGSLQESEIALSKRRGQTLCESLGQPVEADELLDIDEVLVAAAPDAAGDLEGYEGFERGVSEPVSSTNVVESGEGYTTGLS
jgi:hypothetical protein